MEQREGNHAWQLEQQLLPHRYLLSAALIQATAKAQHLLASNPMTDFAAQACRHGHLPTACLLLRRGADAGAADSRGDTPAHLAARHCHLDLLAALLQAGVSPVHSALCHAW